MIVNTLRAKSRKIIIGLQVQGQQRKVEEKKDEKEGFLFKTTKDFKIAIVEHEIKHGCP